MDDDLGLPPPDVEYRLAVRLLAQEPPFGQEILEALVGYPKRYRDLKVLLGGRSENVLTKALRRLRENGLVKQGVDLDAGADKVHSLTELGKLTVFRLHEMVPHAQSIQAYERGLVPARVATRYGASLRARILDAVEKSPGIPMSTLAKTLGTNRSTARYHIQSLKGAGKLQVVEAGHKALLFPHGMPASPALRKAEGVALLREISSHPGARTADLARHLNLSRKILRRHIDRLLREGLISEGAQERYRINPKGVVDVLASQVEERAAGFPPREPGPDAVRGP
ncbi:MAG: winged helix-turn-helix transcriptional regulator [Halobacteriales archaeon]|nr:winged helix-turn-helix transcriptional regulator [Halobacteriales archaeon]